MVGRNAEVEQFPGDLAVGLIVPLIDHHSDSIPLFAEKGER
jgi:hypothetical protein